MIAPTGRLPADAVAVLAAHQRRVGAGPRAEANVARLAAPGTLAVATGQQPGLLGGPLLSLHKAAGAIARARRLADATGAAVVPVFWVASEDHDVAEIDRAVVLDATGRPRALSLGLAADRRSVCDVPVEPAAVARVLEDLRTALPATERGAEALALAAPPQGADVGAWFAALLARVLGDTGLVFVEPRHLAPHAGEVYATLLERAEAIEEGVRAEGEARRARGQSAPLEREAGTAPLFVREAPGGPRARVRVEGERVLVRDRAAPLERRALAARLRDEPGLGSGDVVGRVFVQDALLPVVEIVAGPTELAYLAQVGGGARAVGRPFPALVPRPSAIWVDGRSADALAAFGVEAAAVAEGRASSPPADAGPGAPADALGTALEDLVARVTALREAASSERAPDGGPSSVLRDLDAVRGDLEKAMRRRGDERAALAGRGRARFERLVHALRPLGEPQERVLSPVSLVARHGVEALRGGLATLDPSAPPAVFRLS